MINHERPYSHRYSGSSRMRTIAHFLASMAVAASIAAASTPAHAHSYKLGAIAIGHIWTLPSSKNTYGVAVYGPLLNRGKAAVRLVGASSTIAAEARFRVQKDGHVSWVDSIELQPGKPFALASWRAHIWLSGLKRQLKKGDSFDLTLDFGKSGTLTVKVVVEEAKRP